MRLQNSNQGAYGTTATEVRPQHLEQHGHRRFSHQLQALRPKLQENEGFCKPLQNVETEGLVHKSVAQQDLITLLRQLTKPRNLTHEHSVTNSGAEHFHSARMRSKRVVTTSCSPTTAMSST